MRKPILALAVVLTGCVIHVDPADAWDSVRGDGNKVTQSRTLAGFDRIELRTHLDVEVTEGPAHAVSVTIDENLQPLVTTSVEGGKLIIDSRRGMGYHGKGTVTVSLPQLTGFAIEGSGNVRIAGADLSRDVALAVSGSGDLAWVGKARKLAVAISGSGDVTLRGSAESLDAAVRGSGDVRGKELTARNARLAIAGSGDVAATLDGGELTAAIDGSGDITWYGKGQVETAAVSGSGSIRHR
jgi:hypothetical protein